MNNTLVIASFPDLSVFDFSKTGINISTIENSDYFFSMSSNRFDYVHSCINSLKNKIGYFDIIFVPINDRIIKTLSADGIKCIVLYPNKNIKDSFLEELRNARVDDDYISMISDSWDFMISNFDKYDYEYKFVMEKDDNILNILKVLLSKRDVLGANRDLFSNEINDELVNNVFSYCLLNEVELHDKNNSDKTYCQGIKYDYAFSKKRIYDKREMIFKLIDSIKAIDEGVSISDMDFTKDGKKWTSSFDTLERVMALGISSGDLVFPFPRGFDKSLKGQLPYVIKSSTYLKDNL